MGNEWSVDVQRAALHFVTCLCENCSPLPRAELERMLENVLKTLGHSVGSSSTAVGGGRNADPPSNALLIQKVRVCTIEISN